jgi:hypothetical protein
LAQGAQYSLDPPADYYAPYSYGSDYPQGGYPVNSQTDSQGGYPNSQGGYPVDSQGGYPNSQGGYPVNSQGGYPVNSQGGYPVNSQTDNFYINSESTVKSNRECSSWGKGIRQSRPNDPFVYDQESVFIERNTGPESVFDSRSGGFGDERRWHFNEMLGRPEYDYSDVDAVRAPEYITRHNVDMLPFMPETGFTPSMDISLNDITRRVDQHYIDATNQTRLELQERFMRKHNNERAWQLREKPIHRIGW